MRGAKESHGVAARRGDLPRMMLAFVIRRCAVELGHDPSPAEFAAWANNRGRGSEQRHVFGRPITQHEAAVILEHRSRLVSAQSARPEETFTGPDEAAPSAAAKVTFLDARRKQPRRAQR